MSNKSKTPLFIAIAVLAVIGVGVGWYLNCGKSCQVEAAVPATKAPVAKQACCASDKK